MQPAGRPLPSCGDTRLCTQPCAHACQLPLQGAGSPSPVLGTARRLWTIQCPVGSEDGSSPLLLGPLPPQSLFLPFAQPLPPKRPPQPCRNGPQAGPRLLPDMHLGTMEMRETPAPRTWWPRAGAAVRKCPVLSTCSAHWGMAGVGLACCPTQNPVGGARVQRTQLESSVWPSHLGEPRAQTEACRMRSERAAWALHLAEPSSTACGSKTAQQGPHRESPHPH